jgi:hypothetical protein
MRTETLVGSAVPEQAFTPFHHIFPWLTPLALAILTCLLLMCPKRQISFH